MMRRRQRVQKVRGFSDDVLRHRMGPDDRTSTEQRTAMRARGFPLFCFPAFSPFGVVLRRRFLLTRRCFPPTLLPSVGLS